MTGKITRKFRLFNSQQFYEMFSETSPSEVYFFIAKPTAWPDDANPTAPLDTVESVDYSIWDNILTVKKFSPSNVSFGAARNNWANNSTYSEYSSSAELDQSFFVITDEYKVYKCLSNNHGGASIVKPTGSLTTSFTTADGYIWKYMYSLTVADALTFLTTSYIPVSTLKTDNGTDHWTVQQAAANGGIEVVSVTSGGTNYAQTANTFASAGTFSTATLASDASSNNNFYVGSSVYILTGTGAGQLRPITAYDGTTKIITVSPAFTTAPGLTSTYVISPKVTFTGSGSNASAYSTVSAGAITNIKIINTGVGYTNANVSVSANTGTGAVLKAKLSPSGGHGSDAVTELLGHNVVMSVELTSDDSNFISTNDYRIVGVLADPLNAAGNTAINDIYDQTTRLGIVTPTGNFLGDEVITGTSSGATGTFIEYRGTLSNTAVLLKTSSANFSNGEVITGTTTGFTANVTSVALPELTKYSGSILYFENRAPITRTPDQKENIKIIAKF